MSLPAARSRHCSASCVRRSPLQNRQNGIAVEVVTPKDDLALALEPGVSLELAITVRRDADSKARRVSTACEQHLRGQSLG